MIRLATIAATVLGVVVPLAFAQPEPADKATGVRQHPENDPTNSGYFPPPESKGGWRKLDKPEDIRRLAGMDPDRLAELREWLLKSDQRDFAAVVIRNGYIALEVERGNSSRTDSRRVASVSKAICATVLAIASEKSRQGRTPKKMTFDDPAFDFIPWAKPLSDSRKAKITVKQLLNHTSGICPEATGAKNQGPWEHVLGHDGDPLTAKLAFDPGTRCGYSTFALYHAALVCENVTGKPYDQFAIDALFKPIGCERWSFEHFDGGGKDGNTKYGRHPSHSIGMPARDLARIAYCMMRGGRWENKQVIPKWFVDETAAPTHDVKGAEMRFQRNAQSFSHGWELPARLTGEGGPSGQGIPNDARYKPGSGGQLIAFVPSMDLVVTRQTGSSGSWEYEEYLRRAVAARSSEAVIYSPRTRVTIVDGRWNINGSVTYPGSKAEGLLMNVRMVNSIFEDSKKSEFDPETNTEKFIRRIPEYVSSGIRGFTICLQGGFPGYEGAVNSAFDRDGSLRRLYLNRVQRVIEACDRHGAVVILGCYYQRQDQILKDEEAVRTGVVNVAKWIKFRGFTNVVLEIANEFPHPGFDHRILRTAEGEAELIRLAKKTAPDLLVSTSGIGDGKLPKDVAEASDFLLIHFNGVPLADIPERIKALKKFGKPVVCNEDDKSGERAAKAAELAVTNGASWGLMLEKWNQHFPFHFQGSADDPIAYAKLKELKTATPAEEYQALLKEYEEASRGFRKAETDAERKTAVESMEKFPQRFVELVEKYPKDPIALEVLTQTIRVLNSVDSLTQTAWETNKAAFPDRSKDNSAETAIRLLLRDHIRTERLGLICERMRYGVREEYETFLRKVLKASPYKGVKGLACLSLAEFLKGHLQKLGLIEERPEFAGRYGRLLGKEYFDELQRRGHVNLPMEVETLLEQATEKYGGVKLPYGGTVGEQAKAELFEIRHLTVGKEASDIEGEDQDGKQFKLSDYRGKVVLLYFWSEY